MKTTRDETGRFRRGQAPPVKAKPGMVVETVDLHTLHADPSNANQHPEEDIAGLMAKLATFEQVEPLVVQLKSRKVIGGNGRLEAMRRLGWTRCAVHFVDCDNVTATAMGISLNRRKSLFDDRLLVEQLQALQSEDFDLDAVGYAQTELDTLIAKAEEDIATAEGEEGHEKQGSPGSAEKQDTPGTCPECGAKLSAQPDSKRFQSTPR